MSSLTRYHTLYESLRTRRRKPESYQGLDVAAAYIGMKLRHRRITLAWLRQQAEMVDTLAPDLHSHSDAALDEVVREARELFRRGRQDEAGVRRALAAVREVARRAIGEEAYIVQLMGALALYHGRIVQMFTGEGKTLTGSLAAVLLAWRHKHVHVLTVNDYLAQRDAQSREPIYSRCGCSVGAIVHSMDEAARFETYAKPIVYGTPKQITADWLRDQLRLGPITTAWGGRGALSARGNGIVQNSGGGAMIPGLAAALVDEADAVLIDEGVVPLIIARSRREDDMARVYRDANAVAGQLTPKADYTINMLGRKAELTKAGRQRATELCANLPDAIWRATRRAHELVRQALVARVCYQHGHQYQIVEGQIVIVDEYTGRFLPDRSWEHGLHQAVEAKENLEITADRETLARMSFQRYFRMYPVLSGMTGTAADAATEMERVYQRPVTIIPTNRPLIRELWPVRAFRTGEAKWNAIVESVQQVHSQGRPILVGTRSIETSELLSTRLKARGLEHQVLNANFDKEEADLIALAGKHRAITVATNMAGRGTDIKLDREAVQGGGLHVVLTEMHTAKRVDRQFIGRAGRQGDPGSSQLFVSLEDELARLYIPAGLRWPATMLVGTGGTVAGESGTNEEFSGLRLKFVQRMFEAAQRNAQGRARRSRADVLKHDDWIEKYLPGR